MKVAVIGAGVTGLACAHALARAGHAVTVIDRAPAPGLGASRANGAQLSYAYVAPLAAPGVPMKAPGWMLDPASPLRLRPQADPAQWRWLAAFLRACRREVFDQGVRDLLALAAHSRDSMHELLAMEGDLDFDWRHNGKLVVYRDAAELEGAARLVAFQRALGSEQHVLGAGECLALEPALAAVGPQLAGGIHTPGEEVGDARLFCEELARVLVARRGATLLLGREATGIAVRGGRAVAVETDAGPVAADHVVVSGAIGALRLLAPLGLRVPLYPLKGYSLTLPVGEGHRPPEISVTDAHHKVVYAGLGRGNARRLRVAGMVELVGPDESIDAARLATLTRQARETFPEGGDWSAAEPWAGLRPATPDSKPVIGPSGVEGLWLNLGHGALGFTLCCGTGRILADLISGRPPAIDPAPFRLGR